MDKFILLIFIMWQLFMLAVMAIPFVMMRRGIYMTGRDLFFTFIGMLVMGGLFLIAILVY